MRLTQLIEESFGKNMAAIGAGAIGAGAIGAGLADFSLDYMTNDLLPHLGDDPANVEIYRSQVINNIETQHPELNHQLVEKMVEHRITPEYLNQMGTDASERLEYERDPLIQNAAIGGTTSGLAGAGIALGAGAAMNRFKKD